MARAKKSTTRAKSSRARPRYAVRGHGAYTPRRRYAVRGRGGYWDNVKARWNQGGGAMKSQFEDAGGIIGGPVGRQLGGLLNRGIYALTGFGDYKVQKNILMETNGPPAVVNSGKEFVVRHREYIQDVYSASGTANTPSAFSLLSYPINPGQFTTFPWASNLADKFEQYRVDGIIFEFKSLYSDAVVTQNGSIGSIVLATEYNAGAPVFPNKQAMENYEFAQSCKPSCSVLHPVECARNQSVLSELYVRPATLPVGEDIKTYDFGNFQIASQGIPLGAAGAAVALGELWVSYQITFMKPKIVTGSSSYVDSGFAYFSGVSNNSGFVPYGTTPVPFNSIVKRDTSNLDINLTSDNTFTIKCLSVPMVYQVDMKWYSGTVDATSVWKAPNLTLTNCSFVNNTTSGSYQNVVINTVNEPGNGCSNHSFIRVPAAVPGYTTAVVVVPSAGFACTQTLGVRCEIFWNAVPPGLVA